MDSSRRTEEEESEIDWRPGVRINIIYKALELFKLNNSREFEMFESW